MYNLQEALECTRMYHERQDGIIWPLELDEVDASKQSDKTRRKSGTEPEGPACCCEVYVWHWTRRQHLSFWITREYVHHVRLSGTISLHWLQQEMVGHSSSDFSTKDFGALKIIEKNSWHTRRYGNSWASIWMCRSRVRVICSSIWASQMSIEVDHMILFIFGADQYKYSKLIKNLNNDMLKRKIISRRQPQMWVG